MKQTSERTVTDVINRVPPALRALISPQQYSFTKPNRERTGGTGSLAFPSSWVAVAPAVVQAIKEILDALDKQFIRKYSSIPRVHPKTLNWIDWPILTILNQIYPSSLSQIHGIYYWKDYEGGILQINPCMISLSEI